MLPMLKDCSLNAQVWMLTCLCSVVGSSVLNYAQLRRPWGCGSANDMCGEWRGAWRLAGPGGGGGRGPAISQSHSRSVLVDFQSLGGLPACLIACMVVYARAHGAKSCPSPLSFGSLPRKGSHVTCYTRLLSHCSHTHRPRHRRMDSQQDTGHLLTPRARGHAGHCLNDHRSSYEGRGACGQWSTGGRPVSQWEAAFAMRRGLCSKGAVAAWREIPTSITLSIPSPWS